MKADRRKGDKRFKYVSTEAQVAARNKRRREKYQKNKAYREKVKKQARESLRMKRGKQKDHVAHISHIDDATLKMIGRERLMIDGTLSGDPTFTIEESAKALGDYETQTVRRWIDDGLFPDMKRKAHVVINTARGPRNIISKVYTWDEMKALCITFHAHQKECDYYTKLHESMKMKLFSTVHSLRTGKGSPSARVRKRK